MQSACIPQPLTPARAKGLTQISPVIDWKRNIAEYDRLTALHFDSQDDLETAMELLARHEDVKDAPYRAVGHGTIFVPTEAVPQMSKHFQESGLSPQTTLVRRQEEMTPGQLERAQNRRHLNY